MAKRKAVRFTVSSTFGFPIDMLRYDAAYPASSEDAAKIEAAIRGETKGRTKVALISASPTAPTGGRWESFTWRVEEVQPIY